MFEKNVNKVLSKKYCQNIVKETEYFNELWFNGSYTKQLDEIF